MPDCAPHCVRYQHIRHGLAEILATLHSICGSAVPMTTSFTKITVVWSARLTSVRWRIHVHAGPDPEAIRNSFCVGAIQSWLAHAVAVPTALMIHSGVVLVIRIESNCDCDLSACPGLGGALAVVAEESALD